MANDSYEEALAKRWQSAFATLGIAPFGSLWRVDECVWKAALPSTYIKSNARRSHPGCAVGRNDATLCAAVPMLHGTSSRSHTRETVEVDGVYGEPHKTYFGALDPVPLPLDHWRVRLVGRAKKTTLRPSELQRLQEMLARKGW